MTTLPAFQREIRPTPQDLALCSQALSDWLHAQGAPPNGVLRVELVLEELVMNIITHGGTALGAAPTIALQAEASAASCRLHITDNTPPFNPVTTPPRLTAASLEAEIPGGLGLLLLQRYSRNPHYEHRAGLNQLSLTVPFEPD